MTDLLDPYGRPLRTNLSLENPATPLSNPAAWLVDLWGGKTEAGVLVNRQTAIGYPPLWRGINLISGDVAKLPLVLYRRTDEEEGKARDAQHPAYRLMRRRPNQHMTAFVFKRTLQYHALIAGNGYAAIFRSLGRPVDLLILPPTPTTFPVQRDGVLWYLSTIGGEPVRIAAKDVLHIRGLSYDGLEGHCVLDVMAEALGLGMGAREFGARFFGSGSNQSGILMVPGRFKQEQVAAALRAWDEMATGLNRAHKVALLQDGIKWQPTAVSPEQGQFNETREFEIREVANILGLPPHKLGDSSRTAYNSLEQENKSYLQDGLDHWLCTWEDECNAKLLSDGEQESDSHFFEFLREAYVQMDSEKKIEMLVEQVNNGLLLPDEARAILNRPAYPNGAGQRFRMPSNIMVVAGEQADGADADQPAEPAADPAQTDTESTDVKSTDEAAAQGDIQATALNGAQVDSMFALGDRVVGRQWPGAAAKPAMKIAFPLAPLADVETFIDELEKFEPEEPEEPEPAPSPFPPGGDDDADSEDPDAESGEAADGEDDGEDDESGSGAALRGAHRWLIANDLARMVRRLGNEAKKAAAKPEILTEWLSTCESVHGQAVREVVQDGIVAHCAAIGRPADAEPLARWAAGLLLDAYRDDLSLALDVQRDTPGGLEATVQGLVDAYERDLAIRIAEQITSGEAAQTLSATP